MTVGRDPTCGALTERSAIDEIRTRGTVPCFPCSSSPGATSRSFPLLAARFTSAGTLDTTFDATGKARLTFPGPTPTEIGTDIDGFALDSAGNIVAFGGVPGFGAGPEIFARLTGAGTVDDAFGMSGILESTGSTGPAWCGGVQTDGKIVGGGFSETAMVASWQVERLTTAGVIDTTYGTKGFTSTSFGDSAYIDACVADPLDNLVVVGSVAVDGENAFASAGTPAPALSIPRSTTGFRSASASGRWGHRRVCC